MGLVKWSDKVEGSVDSLDYPLCVVLYKEKDNSLASWSRTYPDAKINCFTWSKEDINWIFPEGNYNEEFKNWRLLIHYGQFFLQALKEMIKTEETYTNYDGSSGFNGIHR